MFTVISYVIYVYNSLSHGTTAIRRTSLNNKDIVQFALTMVTDPDSDPDVLVGPGFQIMVGSGPV